MATPNVGSACFLEEQQGVVHPGTLEHLNQQQARCISLSSSFRWNPLTPTLPCFHAGWRTFGA